MSTQVKEHHTFIDGHKIAFREQGEGSPVILIHGIPTNSLMWRAIIPLLAKTRRVIDLYLEPWSTENGKQAFFRNLRRLNNEIRYAIDMYPAPNIEGAPCP